MRPRPSRRRGGGLRRRHPRPLPQGQGGGPGILPTQAAPDHPLRAIVRAVNARSAALVPTPDGRVRFEDIGAAFLEPEGRISTDIMPDGCHLSPRGYARFADALEPLVQAMLNTR